MEKEIFSKSTGGVALSATSVSSATATAGNWIDTLGYESATFIVTVSSYTGGSISGVSFNGSNIASHSDSTTVTDANTLYQPTLFPVTSNGSFVVGSVAKTRYIQLVLTSALPTIGFAVESYYLLSDALAQPPVINSSTVSLAEQNGYTQEGDTLSTPPKYSAPEVI